ncbi:MAG: ABC transporter substrate-binding protein [Candidatus Krumholzibacteriia bacterium]
MQDTHASRPVGCGRFRRGVRAGVLGTSLLLGSAQGVTLRLAGEGGVGAGAEFLEEHLRTWSERTGHRVESIGMPSSSTERLALYSQYWAAGSDEVDLYLIDVIWPGIAAPHLLDLGRHLGAEELEAFVPRLLEANRVGDRLVALPLWSDVGLLYVRSDLLRKYGYDRPPRTWDELTRWAARIQEGERATDAAFHGYVWQGARYEGLTCNALEWFASFGAGPLVGADGSLDLDLPRAASALEMARGWIGTISPRGVTAYMEEESRQIWQGGHAAFLRSWPYVYALSRAEGSAVRGRFAVAPLPSGPDGQRAATLGGWQLAVSARTRHREAALDLLRFLAGAEVQRARALELGQPPSLRSLYADPVVLAANPHFEAIDAAMQSVAVRPSNASGDRYNEVSNALCAAVHEVLTGGQEPESALRKLTSRLRRVLGRR